MTIHQSIFDRYGIKYKTRATDQHLYPEPKPLYGKASIIAVNARSTGEK